MPHRKQNKGKKMRRQWQQNVAKTMRKTQRNGGGGQKRKKNSAKVKAAGNLHISCTKPSLKQCAGHPD